MTAQPAQPDETAQPDGAAQPDETAQPVAVVTGAAMGIGLGITARFAAGGHAVIGVDRDADALESALAGLRAELPGARVQAYVGDVADPDTHEGAAAAARTLGRLVVWVNNAGVALPGSIHAVRRADVERTIAVNLGGTFWGSAAAIRALLAIGTGGAVVNIASTQAFRGFAEQPAYAATKGAIVALTRQLAAEYAEHRIRCNVVAPGVIDTPLNDAVARESGDPDALRREWLALSPIGRWGQPSDVAEAVWYLGTDAAGFVTGQTLVVDGGQTAIPPGRAR